MKYTEVERKYTLADPERLIGRLTDLGATPAPSVHQIDSYYNAPHRDFLGPDVISEWLRLREQPGKTSINYKRWLPEGAAVKTHCDEYESAVTDLEALRRTFAALDFTPMVVVDKVRQEWRLDDVVVALDQVAGLGSYVEFEFDGDAETVKDALDRLRKFVATLGIELGEPLNHGYPHLLLGRAK
jgi:adenylate cyclase, class 2